MADRKISDLTALTAPAAGDYLPIVDISEVAAASKNKRITIEELFRGVPLGTAAAPSIAIEGDENTGIYSPGADQLAVATNGVGRIFVDASGNVGINTAAGGVSGFGAFFKIKTASSSPGFFLENGAADSWWGIYGGTGTSDSAALIYPSTGSLRIATSTSVGVGGFSEKIRITSAGLVGVGTSAPQSRLQVLDQIRVSNSTQAQGSLVLGDGASTAFNVGIARWNGTTNAAGAGGIGYFSQGAGNVGGHYFYTGDAAAGSQTARMIVNPSGNVGIGTTSPFNALHVVSASAGASSARFSDGSNSTLIIGHAATNLAYLDAYTNLGFYISGSERARIDSSGRLLVGTGSDSGGALFQVNGDRIRVGTAKTPATSGATGTTGEIAWDANYIYVCTATNTWKRSAIATW